MTVTTYQSSYSSVKPVAVAGLVADTEVANIISRSIESDGGIGFGQPAFRGAGDNGIVAGAAFDADATPTAYAGNASNTGTISSVVLTAGAKEGQYNVVIIEPGTNAGKFEVTDPDGILVGTGTVAVAFSAGGLAFTVTDGSTDFVSGEGFTIDVVFNEDADFLGITVMTPAVPADASTPDLYPQYFTVPVLTGMAPIWVDCGDTVASGDDVYWNPATKKYTGTATHVRIPGWKFDMAGSSGNLVQIAKR